MVLLDKRTLRLKTKAKLPIWSGIFFFFSNVQMKKQRQKFQITDVHDWVFPVSNTTSLTLCDLATRVCRALVSLLRAHPSAVYPVMLELGDCRPSYSDAVLKCDDAVPQCRSSKFFCLDNNMSKKNLSFCLIHFFLLKQ